MAALGKLYQRYLGGMIRVVLPSPWIINDVSPNLLQFVFLATISLPLEENPWLRVMPVSLANSLIRESTVRGTGLFDLDHGDLAQLVVVAVSYFAVGAVVFLRLERAARERGVLGVH